MRPKHGKTLHKLDEDRYGIHGAIMEKMDIAEHRGKSLEIKEEGGSYWALLCDLFRQLLITISNL
jgi:hypothetical protein